MTSKTSSAVTTTSASAAGTWKLGDRTVNRIGFGAMRLTANADGTPSGRDRAITVLRRAMDLGVNHIDTAAFYFSPLRSANELINRALAPYPDDLVITTKVGPGKNASGNWLDMARPDQLRGQVEENLRQPAARGTAARWTRRSAPSRPHTGRRPRRSGWPGRCSAGRMCWPSPGPATRITWPPTWPPERCGSRRTRCTALAGRRWRLAAQPAVVPLSSPFGTGWPAFSALNSWRAWD
jgi:hypothetical protein